MIALLWPLSGLIGTVFFCWFLYMDTGRVSVGVIMLTVVLGVLFGPIMLAVGLFLWLITAPFWSTSVFRRDR